MPLSSHDQCISICLCSGPELLAQEGLGLHYTMAAGWHATIGTLLFLSVPCANDIRPYVIAVMLLSADFPRARGVLHLTSQHVRAPRAFMSCSMDSTFLLHDIITSSTQDFFLHNSVVRMWCLTQGVRLSP